MPRVKVQRANKDYPRAGIKKGDTYYKWKFRYGPIMRSLKRPRPSQLTRSKWSSVYAAREMLEDAGEPADRAEVGGLVGLLEEIGDEVRRVAEEYQESADAIEIEGSTVKESCEELAGQLEELAGEIDDQRYTLEGAIDDAAEHDEGSEKDDPLVAEASTVFSDVMSLDWEPSVGF